VVDQHQIAADAVRAVPSAALVGAQVTGLSLPDWAALAGIVFVLLQTAHLVWKWRRDLKSRRS